MVYARAARQPAHRSDYPHLWLVGQHRVPAVSLVSEGTSAASEAIPLLVQALERIFEFRGRAEVSAFLESNPDLLGVVVEAIHAIPQVFPTDRPMALLVVRDPGDEADEGALFAIIPTELEPEEALPRLHDLDSRWLGEAARRARSRFNVDVEYL